jgi:DNA polymerase III subunit epsilon
VSDLAPESVAACAADSGSSSLIGRFAVVDVETSGLDLHSDHVLQIAVVALDLHVDKVMLLSEWSTMIRSRFPWSSVGPRHIHGIRRRDVWRAPPLQKVLTDFSAQIADRIFTAHNAAFDSGFIQAAALRIGQSISLDPRLCTLELSRRLDPDRSLRHRLADIAERHGIPHDNPHDALEDARTTASILPHLIRAHQITSYTDLTSHFLQPYQPGQDTP